MSRSGLKHRMLKGPDTEINLQVLSSGCAEIDRIVMFRDWLRKMSLAQREWEDVQNYADAKTAIIEEILARARE
ncbi:MAG TPA: GrpB family protein [Bryobacteraceae bacterium]|nr:GrpB family protein [Bryobacteraceae bacterium]